MINESLLVLFFVLERSDGVTTYGKKRCRGGDVGRRHLQIPMQVCMLSVDVVSPFYPIFFKVVRRLRRTQQGR